MEIKEALQKYEEALLSINQHFDGCIFAPEIHLEEPWYLDSTDIHFSDLGKEDISEADDFQYSFTICFSDKLRLYEKEEYTGAYVDDGCGNRFHVVFANENRCKEFEP